MDAKQRRKLVERHRVVDGKDFRLKRCATDDRAGLNNSKQEMADLLREGVERLSAIQDKLYAQDRWAVLCIFQAMDAGGKDGAIKHVFSGLNPQGCHVTSFKAPTSLELDHDFLWRHVADLPARGMIGIHNRSWYEEVLIARVHPEVLARQKLPPEMRARKRLFDERLEDIAAFERYLARQGVLILKFFLHLGKDEQRRRFLARIEEPEKNWKFSAADVAERRRWDAYQDAYEAAIRATAAPHAPWYVVPADSKPFARLAVSVALSEALEGLDLRYPQLDEVERAALEEAREALVAEE
ncbi:MAG: polyphosphate kinase 2 family protein [Acetobacteraceae bacterium]|nr:polyphosphate kinase 2 family protein [Acetobacteraceae bacterium]